MNLLIFASFMVFGTWLTIQLRKSRNLNEKASIDFWENENIVSGGYEKRTLLKEVTKRLYSIASENAYRPAYNPANTILKKAVKVL